MTDDQMRVELEKQATLQGLLWALGVLAVFTVTTQNCRTEIRTKTMLCNDMQLSKMSDTTKLEVAKFCAEWSSHL